MGIRQKLGERIKEAREERKITQQVLADTLGINRAVVSDWENGKTSPNLDRMDVLASFLQKPMSYFFTDATEMEGHQVENPAFYVRAYSKTVARLREIELEQKRQAKATATLRKHFASQATILLERLSAEEREAIESADLDPDIFDLAIIKEHHPRRIAFREKHVSRSYATINALTRLMDEVELDDADDEVSLTYQLRLFLRAVRKRGWEQRFKDKELEEEAERICGAVNRSALNEVPDLLRLLSRLEVAVRANWNNRKPDFRLEAAFQASRALVYGPRKTDVEDEDMPAAFADEAAGEWIFELAGATEMESITQVSEFWRLYYDKVDLHSIPF